MTRVAPTDLRAHLAAPAGWTEPFQTALSAAGVEDTDHDDAPGLAVVPGRTVPVHVDRWTAASRPHLLVALRHGSAEVGPWVVPGSGPCARCVESSTLDTSDLTTPTELDLPLVALVAGWVARDLQRWNTGEPPLTWGTSWLLGPDATPRPRQWIRHPYCGCGWFESA